MNIPTDLRYTEHDEWVRVDDNEVVTGITDYAQDQLSDIVYVELPEVGDHFEKGDPFGVVESVKAASDVYMPVTGEIVAVNVELEDEPEIVNSDPFGKGWFIKILAQDTSELDDLMDATGYREHIEAKG
ncbi:MAG: glycine cleavage system protein GcvH [Anaerolineales bacterium]|nr:glycine cleavage system protein GcvH [Anaerolineales bacterium]